MGRKSKLRGCWPWCIALIVVGIVVAALVIIFKKKFGHSTASLSSVDANYREALKTAVKFFDVQKSGRLEDDAISWRGQKSGRLENDAISWRGDSCLKDGKEAKLDLSKGMYDAGDVMKFNFPMAFTATVLSWCILEYGEQMSGAQQLDPALHSLRWITDYLINCHPSSNVLYIQVGDPVADHKCWQRPETIKMKRPLTQLNASSPGTEVAAETAAAMAAASLVYKKSNPSYSRKLLKHAKQLFKFADKYQVSYCESIPESVTYYNSTGFGDELLWAASWLYHATEDQTYLDYVTDNGSEFADFGNPSWFSWDNKLAGTQVLLSRITFFDSKESSNSGLVKYRETAETVMCGLLPSSPTATDSRTEGGLIWIAEWNALQHPVGSAFLAALYADYMLTSKTEELPCDGTSFKPSDLRKFAKSQANYVLGENPMKMSYLVGYGDKYPQFVHHRGASIPADATTGCKDGWKWLSSKKPNPNVALGAMVGGPFMNETYKDSRNNSMQGEPTTYNSAVLVGLLSSLVAPSSSVRSFS